MQANQSTMIRRLAVHALGQVPSVVGLLILIGVPALGHGAIVSIDTTAGAGDTGMAATSTTVKGATSLTIADFDIAATNDDRLLVVAVGGQDWNDAPGTVAVSYGDQALTPINGAEATDDGIYSGFFVLADAGIDAASGDDITVTLGGGMNSRSGDILAMAAIALYDADQNSPTVFSNVEGNGTAAATSVTTTVDGSMVLAALGAGQLWNPSDGSTVWAQEEAGQAASFNATYRTVSTAATVDVEFTKGGNARPWDLSAVGIAPIPEPATGLLLALGLAGQSILRRR